MSAVAKAGAYEDETALFKELVTPAKPKSKPVKYSVKKAKRANRLYGEMNNSELFWGWVGNMVRDHWKAILLFLVNNGLWVYFIWFK